MSSDSLVPRTPGFGGAPGVVGQDWRVDIFPVPGRPEVVREFLYHCFEPFAHGRRESPARAHLVHTHILRISEDWVFRENSADQVEANLNAVRRINARWPGVFRPVRQSIPGLSDLGRIVWIVDYFAVWPDGRSVSPSLDELYAEGLNPSPPLPVSQVSDPPSPQRPEGGAVFCQSKTPHQPLDLSTLMTQVLAQILRRTKPDPVEQPVRAADIYNHWIPLLPGTTDMVQSTPEQVHTIITGIARLNTRWPGAFLEVRPPIPMPDHSDRILWIYEAAKIGSDPGVSDPTLEEVVQTALGNT